MTRDALWSERSLVKTFGPRGTVHLLATRDLPMWTGALSALPPARANHPAHVRLAPEQTDAVVEAIAVALRDGELTADELTEAVVAHAGPWAGELAVPAFQGMWPRWRQALAGAGHRGALCFGANRGRNMTYTIPHRWLPGMHPIESGAALAELLRRYLHAYGPASPEHFARWLNVPLKWTRKLFDAHADELDRVEIEGTAAWTPAGDNRSSR